MNCMPTRRNTVTVSSTTQKPSHHKACKRMSFFLPLLFPPLHNACIYYSPANVPQKFKENPALGIWVNKQRMEYKFYAEGKKSSMNQTKIEALEKAEFIWYVRDFSFEILLLADNQTNLFVIVPCRAKRKGEAAWEEKYRQLQGVQRKTRTLYVTRR